MERTTTEGDSMTYATQAAAFYRLALAALDAGDEHLTLAVQHNEADAPILEALGVLEGRKLDAPALVDHAGDPMDGRTGERWTNEQTNALTNRRTNRRT